MSRFFSWAAVFSFGVSAVFSACTCNEDDTTAPVITVNGAASVAIDCGGAFSDEGASASDDRDGDLSGVVVADSSGVDSARPGTYVVTYNVSDSSGNAAAQATREVIVGDAVAPEVSLNGAAEFALACGSAFNDPGASATDGCDGNVVTTSDAASTVGAAPGTYTVTYSATDAAGNSSKVTRTVTVADATPPTITIAGANPLTADCIGVEDLGVSATDACAGEVEVTSDALAVLGGFQEGAFNVTYTATDPSGNTATAQRAVVLEGPKCVAQAPILDPLPTSTNEASVTITGRAVANALIHVSEAQSAPDTTAGADGRFAVEVELKPNHRNRMFVSAINSFGVESPPAPVVIIQDGELPEVFVDFPPDGAEVTSDTIAAAGRVSDMLSGFMGLEVEVNGAAAEVATGIGTNGSFERGGIPLALGANTITATARDAVGNVRSASIMVTRVPADGIVLSEVSGNGQSAMMMGQVPEPVAVKITKADGTPLPGKVVTFEVIRSDGRLTSGPDKQVENTTMYQARTDANGIASGYWTLGNDAGCANNRIAATSRNVNGTVYFYASATPGMPKKINLGSGDNQQAEAGGPAPQPLRAWVNDGCNGIAGLPITFTVVQGNGGFGAERAQELVVESGETGHAAASFYLGTEPGNNVVEATFEGNPGLPVTFTSYGLRRNELGGATFTGLVLDNSSQPVQGAEVILEVEGERMAAVLSDENGRFEILDIPTGPAHLYVNGLVASGVGGLPVPPGSFPFLHFEFIAVPDVENSLPMPVLLPPLDPDNAVPFDNTEDVVLTCEGMEGLRMIVRAGSMTNPNGTVPSPSNPAILSLNQVHYDDVPMPLPDGVASPFAWTLQPGGSRFDPPIEIEYPNMTGLPAGAASYFLSFNHDTNAFEIVAAGRVSEDASTIVSEPGDGIGTAGWGGNCPPYAPTGDTERCPETQLCVGENPNCDAGKATREVAGPCPVGSRGIACTPNGTLCEDLICDGPSEDDYFSPENLILHPSRALAYATAGTIVIEMNRRRSQGEFGSPSSCESGWKANAIQHMFWQCLTKTIYGQQLAIEFGNAHEVGSNHLTDTTVDLYHNSIGRMLADRVDFFSLTPPRSQCYDMAKNYIDNPDSGRPAMADLCPSNQLSPEQRRVAEENTPPCPAGGFKSSITNLSQKGIGSVVNITPTNDSLSQGESVQLKVELLTESGEIQDRTSASSGTMYFVWNEGVISVDGDGIVTALGLGQETVVVIVDAAGPSPKIGFAVFTAGSSLDGDGDGITDSVEISVGLDPSDFADSRRDLDGDGLSNFEEFGRGTVINNPDSDDDGRRDGEEIYEFASDPLEFDLAISTEFIFSVNGRSARPNGNGSFQISNIPLTDDFGVTGPGSAPDSVSDDWLRLLGSATFGNTTLYAYSEPFRLERGSTMFFSVDSLEVSTTPPPVPSSMRLVASEIILTLGGSTNLDTIGNFADGERDLTLGSTGTTYRTSNVDIATVDADGLVTAQGAGQVFITATNAGATAVTSITVATETITTTVEGFVIGVDGSPLAGVTVTTTFGGSAVTDANGFFSIDVTAPFDTQNITVQARFEEGETVLSGVWGVTVVPGGISDAGINQVGPADSAGRAFALAFQRNHDLTGVTLSLFLSSDIATGGLVEIPGLSLVTPFTTNPGEVTTVAIPAAAAMDGSDVVAPLGILVTANEDVNVYGLNQKPFTTDAFAGLPIESLGQRYRIMSYTGFAAEENASQFAVVAADDATSVTITPSVSTTGYTQGTPYTIVLNRLEVYQLTTDGAEDLTGSLVVSDKPVAVFSGAACTNVPNGYGFCDHLVEQLPPAAAWGQRFLTIPLQTRLNGDTFRIVADQDDTTVTISDPQGKNGILIEGEGSVPVAEGEGINDSPGGAKGETGNFALDAGQQLTVVLNGLHEIVADKPVLVAQFAHGAEWDGQLGDPFMMLIPPAEQFLRSYTFSTPASGFNDNFVNLVARAADVQAEAVLLDGAPINSSLFQSVPGGDFACAKIRIPLGAHTISAPEPLGIYVYGFNDDDSYGYPGGLSLSVK